MNVLQICSKIPYPPTDGGTYAMHVITNGLMNNGARVKVLAISTPKLRTDPATKDKAYLTKTSFESIFIDTSVKATGAFFNLFGNRSYNITRFYSPSFEKRLIELLKKENYDIVHLETLYASPYVDTIRKHSKAKIVLRSQNVEFNIWERVASETANPLKKAYLRLLAKRLKTYEAGMLNRYDGIAAITAQDGEVFRKLGCNKPIITIPFGIDAGSIVKPEVATTEEHSVFHLAAMNWIPNQQGVDWFLNKAWDGIAAKHPALKFYIAGRFMPESLKQLRKPNVEVVGEVADAHRFMLEKNLMIVPLHSGGGMRIKIIEGMALGKTIISTSIGAEGIHYTDGRNILIANTPGEFEAAIARCLNDPAFCRSIGAEAEKLAREEYDNDKIIKRLVAFYKEL